MPHTSPGPPALIERIVDAARAAELVAWRDELAEGEDERIGIVGARPCR